jgi:hypothetical protein
MFIVALPHAIFGQLHHFPKIVRYLQPKHLLKESKEITSEEREVQYIGGYKDTLFINKNGFDLIEEYKIPAKEGRYSYFHPFYADSGISILIDTTQILALQEVIWKGERKINIVYDAIPVIMQNKTDSIAVVGFGRRIPILLEALDTDNKWKSIEKPYIYKCGTGLHNILLKPKDLICVLVPKYKGTFKTQLRLRLRDNISKPFWGEINRNQFLERN